MIILGSQSPKRREILGHFSIPFMVVPSDFDEESIPFAGNPGQHALILSQKKNEVLRKQYPNEVILTADSVVYCDGKLYNKPANEEEAFSFLSAFSGKWQSVFTGVTVARGPIVYSDIEETKILVNTLTPEQIKKFHSSIFTLDKAGGYTIEKSGILIVSRLEGCYDNVLGLPINTTRKLLLKVGIDLWDFLKTS
ncbi:MAG: septum formation protein Maf [Rhabdochlamydiaceae bacterium]|nr:septum formation protein Maf [Rhabdochlamydiaceae bacterium]